MVTNSVVLAFSEGIHTFAENMLITRVLAVEYSSSMSTR